MGGDSRASIKFSIVLLNWNGGEDLIAGVKSVLEQEETSFELLLVDNASKDGSIDPIRSEFGSDPRLKIIINNENLGYCGGTNVGIRAAQGEIVFTMNPDVVLAKDFLLRAMKFFDDKKVGVVAPEVVRAADNTIVDSCGTCIFPHLFATAWGAGSKLTQELRDNSKEIFGVIGAYAFYRKTMLDDISWKREDTQIVEYFDEDFFTYYDEHDLQIRARWRGWKTVFAPELKATHMWRRSVKRGLVGHGLLYFYAFRNYYLSMVKNMTFCQFFRAIPCLLLQECGLIALTILYRKPVVFTAKFAAIPLIPKMLKKRAQIMRTRAISSREFLSISKGTFAYLKFLLSIVLSEKDKGGKLLTFSDEASKQKAN